MGDSQTTVGLTWYSTAIISGATGITTAVANQGLAWIKEKWQRSAEDRRAGRGLALQVCPILTAYARKCYSSYRSNRNDKEAGGFGSMDIPELPSYPDADTRWEAFPPKIAAAIKDFPNDVILAQINVREVLEFADPEDAIDAATHSHISLGYKAWMLASNLRKHYKFGQYFGDSSFITELHSQYRGSNPGWIRRLWRSRFLIKLRRRVRRVIKYFLTLFYKIMGRND